jgi:hypothetical protein
VVRRTDLPCLILFASGVLALLAGLRSVASQRDASALFCFVLAIPLLQAVGALAEGGRR